MYFQLCVYMWWGEEKVVYANGEEYIGSTGVRVSNDHGPSYVGARNWTCILYKSSIFLFLTIKPTFSSQISFF